MSSPLLDSVRDKLIHRLAELLEVHPSEIDAHKELTTYGLDSMAAVGITGELEDWYGQTFSHDLLLYFPTIDSLSKHVVQKLAESSQQEV